MLINSGERATTPPPVSGSAGAEPEPSKATERTSPEGSAESAVRLVNVMRQFEMLQKAVNLGGEMNRAAMEQVARVGN